MRIVGAPVKDAVARALEIHQHPALVLDGIFSHLACADSPNHPAQAAQCEAFQTVVDAVHDTGINPPRIHLANSAGSLRASAATNLTTMSRSGIAIYGEIVEPRQP